MSQEKTMTRIAFLIPDELFDELKARSKKTKAPISALGREALAQYLGVEDVDLDIEWGGKRDGAGKPKQDKIPA
jgi:predicted DNA-binding protein